MVMSGSDERVVFVSERPGDESLVSGGTIARLRSENAHVVLLFGADAGSVGAGVPEGSAASADAARAEPGAARAELDAALDVLDVTDARVLATASVDAVSAVLGQVRASALVIGTAGEQLRDAAVAAGWAAGIPVFLSRRLVEGAAQRLTAIDVSDEVERKLRAINAYPSRWRVTDHAVALPDGSRLTITGTEAYLRVDAPRAAKDEPPTPAGRLATGAFALMAGVLFGVLGTIAHQATVSVGAVALPVGLILALVGAAALLIGLRMVLRDRMVVLLAAIGMLGTIFVLSLRSAGGSVLVPEGLAGTLWTVVPALAAVVAVGWPRLPARRRGAGEGEKA